MLTAHVDWWFRRSRLRWVLQLIAGGGAVLATAQVSPQQSWQWLALLICWGWLLREILSSRRWQLEGLSLRAGRWYLLQAGERLPADLLRYHLFGIRFVVLTFRSGRGETWRVSILPDMLARAEFRRLRVVLQAH